MSKSSRKSMHEVIVFEVGLTPFKTNKENISTLQQLEGKKMLLLGMPALFSAKEVARKHKENVLSHIIALRAGNLNSNISIENMANYAGTLFSQLSRLN